MLKRFVLLSSSSALFFFFIAFSFLIHKNVFIHSDFNTTVRLQDHIPRSTDTFFSFLSLIGSFEPMVIMLVVVLVLFRKIRGIFAFAAFGVLHIIELYGKFFVEHRPPPHFMLRTEKIGNFPQFYVSAENSYPSGHAARAVFITILIGFLIWRSKKLPNELKVILLTFLVVYDLVMLTSRVYLGEHWLSDVVGGALLGGALSLFGVALL